MGKYEPKTDSLDDTRPNAAIQDLNVGQTKRGITLGPWRHVVGMLCLVGAGLLTTATLAIYLLPGPEDNRDNTIEPTEVSQSFTPQPTQVLQPTTETQNIGDVTLSQPAQLPTLSPEQIQVILSEPLTTAVPANSFAVVRNLYDPFTIIPDRPRGEVIQYVAETGDTINSIAERFDIEPASVAWANDRRFVRVLRPGDTVNILPVDGVYHQAVGSKTFEDIAEQYGVDVFTILYSEYNSTVRNMQPDTVPPSGTWLVVPGGTAEPITWNPTVVRSRGSGGTTATGSTTSNGFGQISFAPGDPGSCGMVDNPGGGAAWVRPIDSYTWMRGFAAWHPAVDVAASEGTPVKAANSGRVIFAGWSNWGYGYAVVLAHGPFTTLYAHMSAISVNCSDTVSAGQQIGATGNTGNSSGPHLHFEVRYDDAPQDPTLSVSF